jgi:hypothetical protein
MMLQQGVLEDRTPDWIHRKTAEADIYFVVNQGEKEKKMTLCPWEEDSWPELWNPYSGAISFAPEIWKDDSVNVTLDPGSSIFVVIDHGKKKYGKSPQYIGKSKVVKPVGDVWDVDFVPKVDEPFSIKSFTLKDFSQCDDERLMYFAGTATYTTKVVIDEEDLVETKRIVLDLGEMNDLGELTVNGEKIGVFWYPPHVADITRLLKAGENVITVAVTNNWANRLIGDERLEADFEWGTDRGVERGRAMKAFPDWFLKDGPRPSGRKAFVIWSYYRSDSELQPAGLVGPVNLLVYDLYIP